MSRQASRSYVSPAEFREAVAQLGVSLRELAGEIGVNDRTLARMAEDGGDGPSPPVWYVVQCALRGEIRRPIFMRGASLD